MVEAPETRTAVQHFDVTEDEAGQRLDNYVQRRLGVPRSRVYRVIRKGEVRVNGKRADPATRLSLNDRIRVPPVRVMPAADPGKPSAELIERMRAAIIHEDERLLVMDKPAGRRRARRQRRELRRDRDAAGGAPGEYLELAHRLDRDTSGCLVIARRAPALRSLHALLREDGFEKRYLALLKGPWNLGAKRIDAPLRHRCPRGR